MAAEIEERTQYDWFNVARVYEQKGEFDKALEAYEEAIALDAGFAKAWYYKAKLHHQLGQKAKAEECARKVLILAPKWEKHIREFLPDI
ncbi:MAG: tetratricopeptide repeat protein [Candidatus Thorarchaeota archaeon]|nr:tetratricopeptide repeat protein [Candidatus Thorarchaeota archaeon]